MSRYTKPEEGEWVQPIHMGYKLACCDCGLVHTINFRIKNGHVQFRAYRNNRSTAMMRRHKGLRKQKDGSYVAVEPPK